MKAHTVVVKATLPADVMLGVDDGKPAIVSFPASTETLWFAADEFTTEDGVLRVLRDGVLRAQFAEGEWLKATALYPEVAE